MDVILASFEWQFALVYVNNTVIFSKTPKKHIDHVRQVLKLLQLVGVILKLNNCFFLADTINYFERVIRP